MIRPKCSCGTKDQALVWCFIHGYLTKPPVVKRIKKGSKRE